MLQRRGVRVAGGIALLVLAPVLLVYILTNDDRDRAGAALVGLMVMGGIHLLRGPG